MTDGAIKSDAAAVFPADHVRIVEARAVEQPHGVRDQGIAQGRVGPVDLPWPRVSGATTKGELASLMIPHAMSGDPRPL